MHREGRTHQTIGKALEVPQKMMSNSIDRLSQKRDAAKTAKPSSAPTNRRARIRSPSRLA
jgi:hypothetical protein